ncbi:MAG: hypothetical protein E3J87_09970 [Candidatus Cloacimonadota bacterium]|nr:MAG: hypothetical protein E3J87_09970 [Candidatus Cloacimonadota bacterium]
MRRIIILLLLLVIALPLACTRCEMKSAAEKIELPDKLKVTNDLKRIRDAIIIYRTLNEANPSSIEDLELELYYPDKYIYDSKKGTVKSTIYPDY